MPLNVGFNVNQQLSFHNTISPVNSIKANSFQKDITGVIFPKKIPKKFWVGTKCPNLPVTFLNNASFSYLTN